MNFSYLFKIWALGISLTAMGYMPAESFVRIWKFIARPNLCVPTVCVKPPPRYLLFWDSVYGNIKSNK